MANVLIVSASIGQTTICSSGKLLRRELDVLAMTKVLKLHMVSSS